jgi:hypothetical protein
MAKKMTQERIRCVDNLLKLILKKVLENREKCTNIGGLVTKFAAYSSGASSSVPERLENIRDFKVLVPWHRSCY